MHALTDDEELIPRLRGAMHAIAAFVAVAVGTVLVVLADGSRARVAAAIYAIGLVGLFVGSGLFFSPAVRDCLRKPAAYGVAKRLRIAAGIEDRTIAGQGFFRHQTASARSVSARRSSWADPSPNRVWFSIARLR